MSKKEKITIQIDKDIADKLKSKPFQENKRETYNDIIERMIDEIENLHEDEK